MSSDEEDFTDVDEVDEDDNVIVNGNGKRKNTTPSSQSIKKSNTRRPESPFIKSASSSTSEEEGEEEDKDKEEDYSRWNPSYQNRRSNEQDRQEGQLPQMIERRKEEICGIYEKALTRDEKKIKSGMDKENKKMFKRWLGTENMKIEEQIDELRKMHSKHEENLKVWRKEANKRFQEGTRVLDMTSLFIKRSTSVQISHEQRLKLFDLVSGWAGELEIDHS